MPIDRATAQSLRDDLRRTVSGFKVAFLEEDIVHVHIGNDQLDMVEEGRDRGGVWSGIARRALALASDRIGPVVAMDYEAFADLAIFMIGTEYTSWGAESQERTEPPVLNCVHGRRGGAFCPHCNRVLEAP